MSVYVMTVAKRTFRRRTIEGLVTEFWKWRDRRPKGRPTMGSHWPVLRDGERVGDVLYDGRFWSKDEPSPAPFEIVDRILEREFPFTFDSPSRSPEYIAGVRAALENHLLGVPSLNPHTDGTAQADAFYAGVKEGWRLAEELTQ